MNKNLILVLCSFLSGITTAQVIDNFTDGNFTANPVWSGDVSSFVISNDTLRSNGPEATASNYLSTQSVAVNSTTWQFSVKLDFSPSTSNQVKIYIVSDNANLTKDLNGYYISIGQSNDDQIKFYKQTGSSSTLLFSGSTLFTTVPVEVSIKIERDNLGTWDVFADTLGGTNFVSEGVSFFDDTFINTAYFGIVCNHTSTRNDLFYFDNFSVTVPPDSTPPSIVAIMPISITEIDILFDEPVDRNIAETVTNYKINRAEENPIAARLNTDNAALVHLTFTNAFANNSEYVLTVDNMKDVHGNEISSTSTTFAFLLAEIAGVGDIIINEIFADPNPTVGLPEAEFIEIFNRSDKYIDLAYYSISGATITNEQYIIAPEKHIILCDAKIEEHYQEYGEVIGISAWNKLTNSGETITLLNEDNGLVVDDITYDNSWYQDNQKDDGGYSLELINPNSLCVGSTNWKASNNADGGTPGASNSIYNNALDTVSPKLVLAAAINSDSLILVFDESLYVSTIDKGAYTITPSILIKKVVTTANGNTIAIQLLDALVSGQEYTISVSGVSDCAGNYIVVAQSQLFRLPDVPVLKDVIINEFMPDPFDQVGLPESEFVELYNRSSKVFNLGDFRLNGKVITTKYREILPDSYVILCPEEYAREFELLGKTIGLTSWDVLTNNGESITLYDTKNNIKVDELMYSLSWYKSSIKKDGGWSLELIDAQNLCSSEENWTATIQSIGGTPGKKNSVIASKPDLRGPVVEEVIVVAPDSLIIQFNENLDSLSVHGANYTISHINSLHVAYITLKKVLLVLDSELSPQTLYTLVISDLKDCTGNYISKDNNMSTFALSEEAVSGDIVLNEVLFNPRADAPDFIELYNNSNKFIDLQDWMIANKDKNGEPANSKIISTNSYVMAPQQYVVLTKEVLKLANEYPAEEITNFIEMGGIPSFPNEQGSVILLKPDSSSFEVFDYHEDYHHTLLSSVDGVSLERINVDGVTNNSNNWHSAASTILATPGYLNSQVKGGIVAQAPVTISPEVFIPNQNGIDDFTTIHYEFDSPGFVVTIRIVDGLGRVIKRIVEYQTLPLSGDFQWDGTSDNGRKARIGSYMVFVEAFDTNGIVKHYRERVVVGSEW